jgi:hypothetical protein
MIYNYTSRKLLYISIQCNTYNVHWLFRRNCIYYTWTSVLIRYTKPEKANGKFMYANMILQHTSHPRSLSGVSFPLQSILMACWMRVSDNDEEGRLCFPRTIVLPVVKSLYNSRLLPGRDSHRQVFSSVRHAVHLALRLRCVMSITRRFPKS